MGETSVNVGKPELGDGNKSVDEISKAPSNNITAAQSVMGEVRTEQKPDSNGLEKDAIKKRAISGESDSEDVVKKIKSNRIEDGDRDKDGKKRKRSGDDAES